MSAPVEPATVFLDDVARGAVPGRAWSGVVAGAVPLVLAHALRREPGRPALVVVPAPEDVDALVAELGFHLPGREVLPLPADDVPPFDGLSPDPALVRARLVALDRLARGAPAVLVAPARALAQRVPPPALVAEWTVEVAEGDVAGPRELAGRLVDIGYLSVPRADEPGTVAWRGGVLDAWSPGDDAPVRIEFFDNEADEIRCGRERLRRARFLPAREARPDAEALRRAAERTAAAVAAIGGGHRARRRVLEALEAGTWFPGAEDYAGALHPLVGPLEAAAGALLAVVEPADAAVEVARFVERARTRWAAFPADERPVVLPEDRLIDPNEVAAGLRRALRLGAVVEDEGGALGAVDLGCRDNAGIRVQGGDLGPVVDRLRRWLEDGWRVVLACESRARLDRVAALLRPHGLVPEPARGPELPPPGRLAAWIGPLGAGFHCPASQVAVLTAGELFAGRRRPAAPAVPRSFREAALSSVTELRARDLVVHPQHGIGRFLGLRRLRVPHPANSRVEVEQDTVEIEYAGGDRLFLPVSRIDRLFRYRAVGNREPRLDRLGGRTWARRKARVRDRVLALAHEVLALHGARRACQGHAYPGRPELLRQFEEAFPYEETPDQARAIEEVLADLARPEPMDRLLVGDVGFGKTEVAMRAAMRVVLDGRQVVVLCPTTVLAYQHHEVFRERMEPFGVRVEVVSRFRSRREVRETLAAAAEGGVDVLVGTHAVLGRDVRFRDLGLVVIDEEHRFGVRQKQALLRLARTASRVPCDVLSMSATPIPRSLHLALGGLRDVSVIATPPEGRRAIRTRIARWNDEQVREEVLRELRRGGQVFFVHNRVDTLETVAARLRDLVPEARVRTAHGQLSERELERVLVDFVRRRFDVLACTTIIESGLDMPNVNTMIVDEAHRLGLAQLYQLRGRVGRGAAQAYCTFLLPEHGEVPAAALRRLRVLQDHAELGAGFAIAAADLELRGAGELLGEKQHGHIQAVGLDTYVELLEEAVAVARGEQARERIDPEIELPVDAFLPEDWVPDTDERLAAYRRLFAARTVDEVRREIAAWEREWEETPAPALALGWLAEARVRCRALGIERVSWLKVRLLLDFHEQTPVTAEQVAALVQAEPGRFGLDPRAPGRRRLVVRLAPEDAEHPFQVLHVVLRRIERAARGG